MNADRQTDRQTNGRNDGPDEANVHFFESMRKRKYESENFVPRLASTDTYVLLD